jgi:hypothetical protein
MDERVRLVTKPSRAVEFRIKAADAEAMGMERVASEIHSRGVDPEHLGEPVFSKYTRLWTIPVRRGDDE